MLYLQDKGGIKTGLAAKVDVGQRGDAQETTERRFPELLLPITEVLLSDEYAGSMAEELPFHPYASPFLQAFLSAQRGNRYLILPLHPYDASNSLPEAYQEGC